MKKQFIPFAAILFAVTLLVVPALAQKSRSVTIGNPSQDERLSQEELKRRVNSVDITFQQASDFRWGYLVWVENATTKYLKKKDFGFGQVSHCEGKVIPTVKMWIIKNETVGYRPCGREALNTCKDVVYRGDLMHVQVYKDGNSTPISAEVFDIPFNWKVEAADGVGKKVAAMIKELYGK